MNCVILQPSFIPWRGYFHQIQKADLFVFYDCVQYDKGGWRNRNRIKTPHGTCWLTIPVNAPKHMDGLPISEVRISDDRSWRRKHLATLEQSYSKAPAYEWTRKLVDEIYDIDTDRLADLTCRSTELIARYLGIEGTRFVRSSSLGLSGRRTDRLLDALEKVGATRYLSGPAARSYLEPDRFAERGIELEYMTYDYEEYPQLHGDFDASMSILDLMFNVGGDAGRHIWGCPVLERIRPLDPHRDAEAA